MFSGLETTSRSEVIETLTRLTLEGELEAGQQLLREAQRLEDLQLALFAEQALFVPSEQWPGFGEWGRNEQGEREFRQVRTGLVFVEQPDPESFLLCKTTLPHSAMAHFERRLEQALVPAPDPAAAQLVFKRRNVFSSFDSSENLLMFLAWSGLQLANHDDDTDFPRSSRGVSTRPRRPSMAFPRLARVKDTKLCCFRDAAPIPMADLLRYMPELNSFFARQPMDAQSLRVELSLRVKEEFSERQAKREQREQERRQEEALQQQRQWRALELERRAPPAMRALLEWDRLAQSADPAERQMAAAKARVRRELEPVLLGVRHRAILETELAELDEQRLLRTLPRDKKGVLEPGLRVLLSTYDAPQTNAGPRATFSLEGHTVAGGELVLRLVEHPATPIPSHVYTLRFDEERVRWDRRIHANPTSLWGFAPSSLANHHPKEFLGSFHRARSEYFYVGRTLDRQLQSAGQTIDGPAWRAARFLSRTDHDAFVEAFCIYSVDLLRPLGLVAAIELEGEEGRRREWIAGLHAVLRQCAPWRWRGTGHLHTPIVGNPYVITLHSAPEQNAKLSLQSYEPRHLLPRNAWAQPQELLMARYSDIDFG